MINNYPLKTTKAINLSQIFEQYISSYYGTQAWVPVKDSFEKMNQIRQEFDLFGKTNVSLATDPSTCAQFEKLIINYLQYCQVIGSKFRFESYQQGSVDVKFPWSDSFNPQNQFFHNSQLNYEQCCILYNLAIVYYSWGCNLSSLNTTDDKKEAIKKFRYGIWALDDLKNKMRQVDPKIKDSQKDFSLENISILENMMFGLIYVNLYENLYPQRQQLGGVKNVVQLAGEAAKFFSIAKGMIDQIKAKNTGYPKDLINSISAKCEYNFAYYNAITAQQLAVHHESLIQDEPRGNHMGYALSYLRKGDQLLKKIFNDKALVSIMSNEYQNRLKHLHTEFLQQLPAAEQRNNEIYKHAVKTPDQLPATQITFQNLQNLGGLQPPQFENKLQGTEGFQGFLNEEQIHIMNECKSTAETRIMELNQVLTQITDTKNRAYLENYVNVVLDAGQAIQQSNQIPQNLQQKLNRAREIGGKQKFNQQVQNLKELSVNCGMMLNNLRQKIDQEAQFDNQMRQQYGAQWNRTPSSDLNKDYLQQLNNYDGKFKQAQQADSDNLGKVSQMSNDLEIVDKSNQEIMNMLPKNSDQQFAVQNQNQINELRNLDNNFNQQINSIRQSIQNLSNLNINYAQEVASCIQKNVPKDQIQQCVLKTLFDGIEEINKQVSMVSSIIGNVCNLAQELNSKRGGSNQGGNGTDQVSNALHNFVDTYELIQGGIDFYGQLLNRLSTLEHNVQDFLMARENESQNLQQLIGRNNQQQQQLNANQFGVQQQGFGNFQVQQNPFYNPQSGQFPVGQSTYVPQNQNNQQQQQWNQPPGGRPWYYNSLNIILIQNIIRKKPHYLGVGVSVILGGYIFYKILQQRINKSENEEENHIEENQEELLQKDEWYNNIDPSSLSNLNDFTTLHYDIDYFIEFNKKKLAGKINYTFESKASDLKKIILDVKCLLIYEVTNEQDQVLNYHIQSNPKYKEDLGDQLVITLDKTYQQSEQFTIRIFFDTFNPDNRPTAINWLNPEQTRGKKYPFLFTQCEPIFARTLFPCQDSPSVKATFNATLRTNNKISAYCSGQLTQVFDSDFEKVYLFEQTIPIPAYLFALLAGDLKQNKISERCYVIAEPSFIDQCCSELDEMETQLKAIEDYLTPYKWKEYKIAILPPSFPYGGMENPLLTFASPTIIVGDKSQTQVVIHEMVHSWSGNLVSCKNWRNFFLNEGFTVFIELKVVERLYGKEKYQILNNQRYQELVNAVRSFGSKHEYTKLQPNLKHNNPDDAFSQVPYVKGCQFLMYLERELGINGEQIFQEFLKKYFIQFEQQSIDYEDFMIFYRSFLKERLDRQQFQQYFDKLKLQDWLYEPGLPIETSSFESIKLNQMNDLLNQFIKNPLIIIQDPLKFHNLENDLKPLFLNGILQNKQKIKSFNNVISQMETQLQMNANYLHKYEIGVKWMLLAISASHQQTIEQVEQILGSVGRMKYLRPIYKALIQNGYKSQAQKIFQKNKLFYHTIAAKMIGKDIL